MTDSMAIGDDAIRACDGSVGAPFSGADVSAALNLEALVPSRPPPLARARHGQDPERVPADLWSSSADFSRHSFHTCLSAALAAPKRPLRPPAAALAPPDPGVTGTDRGHALALEDVDPTGGDEGGVAEAVQLGAALSPAPILGGRGEPEAWRLRCCDERKRDRERKRGSE